MLYHNVRKTFLTLTSMLYLIAAMAWAEPVRLDPAGWFQVRAVLPQEFHESAIAVEKFVADDIGLCFLTIINPGPRPRAIIPPENWTGI
jgi:hypothetical protein